MNFGNINIMLTTILKEMGIPDHLTCLLRNLYAGQEATVRTGHGTTDCCQIGPHPEEPRFSLLAREDGSFPCVIGKEFLAFPSHLKRRRSPQERRGTSGSCHHSQSPPYVSVHSRETCFSCTASTFKTRILGGTWNSPMGKPRGKVSWERQ